MAKCGSRTLLYIVTALQLISTTERQIFDFLGYMWIPIAGNFFNIIFVILGIFGIYQYHTWYIVAYLVWTLAWVGWNAFLICFYLDVGHLDNKAMDLLSFGTGSYTWWWTNGFGCKPDFFGNDTLSTGGVETGSSGGGGYGHPPKPKSVTGCVLEYQYVEVTHSAVQLLFGLAGVVIACFVAHFYITVVDRKRKLLKLKSKNPHMYSIEYSPQGGATSINGGLNTLDSSDLYAVAHEGPAVAGAGGNGGGGGHMTPRRVKRRSYTRSSARSASAAGTSNKAAKGSNHRSSTRSLRTTGKRGQQVSGSSNPVNRLMDDQHRHSRQLSGSAMAAAAAADSSTSNDETRNAMIAAEKAYGQINPGFQSSRPNSLVYSLQDDVSHAPGGGGGGGARSKNVHSVTDYEVSRPPSALTSYSNFHPGARRNLVGAPAAGHQTGPGSFQLQPKTLTQDSFLMPGPSGVANNQSDDDDLPPPPPPLSSSPTPQEAPVPLQRTAPARRSRNNEYVNMPVSAAAAQPQHPVNSNHPSQPVSNDMSSLISSSSPDSSIQAAGASGGPPPPPLPPHMPRQQQQQELPNYVNTSEVHSSQGPPPLLKRHQNFNGFQQQNQQPSSFSSGEPQSYNDTQTLRADDTRLISQQMKQQQSAAAGAIGNHFSSPFPAANQHQQQQPREITIDYEVNGGSNVQQHRYQHINSSSESANSPVKPEPERSREPVGNRRTENRSSLRAKQRREMEEKTRQQQQQPLQNGHYPGSRPLHHQQQQQQRQEDDYGFTSGGGGGAYAAAPPAMSPPHAGNCKCYRCQRKLTAI